MRKLSRQFTALFALVLFFSLMTPALVAQEAEAEEISEMGAVFEEPQDVILVWAKRAGLAVTFLGMALILFVLLFRRDRLMESQSKWLLFVGLCLLPVPMAFLSGGVGMEESKAVEFCHSCHEPMDPFVEDMMNPESENLAALHFNNRYIQHEHCWTCHSDYGIAGTAEAKMTGMIHIYKYTTGTWEAPIKLYHPYQFTICLECHAGSAKFKEIHDDELVQGVVNRTSEVCTDCHGSAHPEPEERRASR